MLYDLVSYDTRRDDRGRLQACAVEFVSKVSPPTAAHHNPNASDTTAGSETPLWIPLSILVLILGFGLVVNTLAALWIIGIVAVMSIATFIAYGQDKAAAQGGAFRTQESALHAMELAGGWPGALIAQRHFRHKTRKQSYQAIFWLYVALNLLCIAVVCAVGLLQ